jgi:hypothetical protein
VVDVTLTQVQWHAVRRAEGGSFYTWETERREVPAGQWQVTTAGEPQPLHVPLAAGGYFVLRARAADAGGPHDGVDGLLLRARPRVHGVGAPRPQPHRPRPREKRYGARRQARILVKSPWDSATALLTTEREGIRTHRTFQLRSTQETVVVPDRGGRDPPTSTSPSCS